MQGRFCAVLTNDIARILNTGIGVGISPPVTNARLLYRCYDISGLLRVRWGMHGEGEAIAIQLTHPITHNNARVMTPQKGGGQTHFTLCWKQSPDFLPGLANNVLNVQVFCWFVCLFVYFVLFCFKTFHGLEYNKAMNKMIISRR